MVVGPRGYSSEQIALVSKPTDNDPRVLQAVYMHYQERIRTGLTLAACSYVLLSTYISVSVGHALQATS